MEEYKICISCDRNLEISNFYKNKSSKDGYHSYCKECTKEKSKKWQIENYEVYQKGFNKRARKRRENPENLKYHREKAKEQRETGYLKTWQRKNKEKIAEYREDREMHKTHNISNEEWENCKKYFNNECAYCRLKIENHFIMYKGKLIKSDFHKEHVDHNGSNDLSNCVPSCKSCNSKKWKYKLNDWYNNENEIFDIHRYEKIIKWLNEDYTFYRVGEMNDLL